MATAARSAVPRPAAVVEEGMVNVLPANISLLLAAREAIANVGQFLRRNLAR
ncbi:MAG: hypothetical protein ABIQ16_25930 [Polyangiaceae bacterium]